jgi:putative hemolysin
LTDGGDEAARHIVDLLIEERAPGLLGRPLARGLARRLLYPKLGYHAAKAMADRIRELPGAAIMDFLAAELALEVQTIDLSRLPASGRVIVAANHPTGLADGVAIWQALRGIRPDLRIFANQDALRVAPRLGEVIIPVPWGKQQRRAASGRRVLAEVASACAREAALLIFPSGRLAFLHRTRLRERPWLPAVVTLARRFAAPILPVHIRARNSGLFYALSRVSDELRDITLFHELLNKRGRYFTLTFGLPVDPRSLPPDPAAAVRRLQHHVEYKLPRGRAGSRLPIDDGLPAKGLGPDPLRS